MENKNSKPTNISGNNEHTKASVNFLKYMKRKVIPTEIRVISGRTISSGSFSIACLNAAETLSTVKGTCINIRKDGANKIIEKQLFRIKNI